VETLADGLLELLAKPQASFMLYNRPRFICISIRCKSGGAWAELSALASAFEARSLWDVGKSSCVRGCCLKGKRGHRWLRIGALVCREGSLAASAFQCILLVTHRLYD